MEICQFGLGTGLCHACIDNGMPSAFNRGKDILVLVSGARFVYYCYSHINTFFLV
jgi:hypothetical protein